MAGFKRNGWHISRTIPLLLLMGLIFFLSHQEGTFIPLTQVPYLDKLAHFSLYSILAAATLFALPDYLRLDVSWRVATAVILFSLMYGISDELHQASIPGRDSSIKDLLADVLGASFMTFLWFRVKWQKLLPLPEPALIKSVTHSGTS